MTYQYDTRLHPYRPYCVFHTLNMIESDKCSSKQPDQLQLEDTQPSNLKYNVRKG